MNTTLEEIQRQGSQCQFKLDVSQLWLSMAKLQHGKWCATNKKQIPNSSWLPKIPELWNVGCTHLMQNRPLPPVTTQFLFVSFRLISSSCIVPAPWHYFNKFEMSWAFSNTSPPHSLNPLSFVSSTSLRELCAVLLCVLLCIAHCKSRARGYLF